MKVFKNIKSLWPEEDDDLQKIVEQMINNKNPWYLNLRR
jgi:hypothetical protein